jgi:hypothetical protein
LCFQSKNTFGHRAYIDRKTKAKQDVRNIKLYSESTIDIHICIHPKHRNMGALVRKSSGSITQTLKHMTVGMGTVPGAWV